MNVFFGHIKGEHYWTKKNAATFSQLFYNSKTSFPIQETWRHSHFKVNHSFLSESHYISEMYILGTEPPRHQGGCNKNTMVP